MTNVDQGTLGAKRATWDEDDPRPIAMQIISSKPHLSETDGFKLFWSQIESETPALQSMARYWWHNAWLAMHRGAQSGHTKPSASTIRDGTQAALKTRVQYEAGLLLLDLLMPNNKPLGECTGAECTRFSGWFAKLADKVPANKSVAEVLTEDQVRALWKASYQKKTPGK